ncbi:DNA polymerase II [Catenovulum sp. 2E275]|uniref:DNA polymerase II n=1 Tax=Catenovulum sp. 2E275 TaxID=2980497 RepID=UPI0021D0705B|nr:DNA polymerase II [Catenovulum sp. 2E275]MCU4676869.1 DNA polymerase II [Catenovulum sp. 2E275]
MFSQGFILTRNARDTAAGCEIHYWLTTPNGACELVLTQQKPVFIVLSNEKAEITQHLTQARLAFEWRDIPLKTFSGQPVAALYFQTLKAQNSALNKLKQANIDCFEYDLRLADRILTERFIYGSVEFSGDQQAQQQFINPKIKPCDYQPDLSYISLDVECSMQGELYSVALQNDQTEIVIMIGEQQNSELNIIWVVDEKSLLIELVKQISALNPDLIIGWNVINFDFRLLIKRAELNQVTLTLGRDNSAISWRDNKTDKSIGYVSIAGRVVIDGIDALKVATYQFDSFSLQHVSQQLLAKQKLIEDVDNRGQQITYDFLHNKLKLARYNLEDCRLVSQIFAKTRLIDFLRLRTQLTGLELDRQGGSVAAFTNLYLPKLHRAGYVAPNLPQGGGLASPGGYVMNSKPGLYKNVLVLDFKSLYPSIIRTFKIDPMGLIEGLNEPDNAIEGFKGAKFSREKHFLPDIITSLWQQRDQAKQEKDAARSQAIKIIMNSFYGVLGSGGCRFYDTRLASSITMRGHQIMQQTAQWIEQQGYEVIYGDTDSTFVWLEQISDPTQAKQIGQQLADGINQYWQNQLKQAFNLTSELEIEFETLYSTFLMPTIRGSEAGSKKRYAGLIKQADQDKLVFKGLETVRSDWTELAHEFQTELYRIIFAEQNPTHYIQTIISQVQNGDRDHQLIYKKRLRRKLEAYVKNIPPQVRAARLADNKNKQLGKRLKYQNKGWIKYLITLNGPEPVEYQTSIIDYQHYIDKQIKPIAEGILPFIGLSFTQLNSRQLSLF